MSAWVWVMAGGALGAAARYGAGLALAFGPGLAAEAIGLEFTP